MTKPGLMIDQCRCTTLRRAARRVTQLYDNRLAPTGLRATQLALLMVIEELGQVSVGDLGRHLDLDRTSTTRALRSLQADGHVEIAVTQSDRRKREICLTAKGRAALPAAMQLWLAAQQDFESSNGREWSDQLSTALHAIRT